ncbi:MAG: hypothetical protein AAFZ01_00705 [Pseudomonadota bacterium]
MIRTLICAGACTFALSTAAISATPTTNLAGASLAETITLEAKKKCKKGKRFSTKLGRCVRSKRGSY